MKNTIGLFSSLGQRLADFGSSDSTRQVIERACCANGWFTHADILRSVSAIAKDMLSRERLEEWLMHYPVPVAAPRRVLVVMAGNIPLVGFFDLLCVVASGHRCLIKPSAKDRVLMEYIVGLLRQIDPAVPVEFYDGRTPVDAVIATGSDNANRYFRMQYAGIPALLRGNRQSVAVLSGLETPEQLIGLADDIWAYSGMGCRSVSLLFIPEGYDLKLTMPVMNEKYCNNYRQQKALLSMTDNSFRDLGAALAVEKRAFPRALSCINYTYYKAIGEVETWLAAHDAGLQCVVSECVVHSRRTGFGRAQSPALTDYPDERDVIAFLAALN
ncbi:acyl-CoA reductase [uncultured Alistipes sp.]|jgi:acyl-coA reductase (luxC)|uniref:acyl-CoA reductase n=1 Tax=uncultured Alistipes sp. TaxID=538949 RepID=UPI0025F0F27B|nr:acyl-CoA reductase [uncultured Alistipes sp.]